MTRRSTIGFDRRIHIEWLDAAAGQVAAGSSDEEVREYLWNLLEGVVSGDKSNSARGKTVTVLNHIWGDVAEPAVELRARAAQKVATTSPDGRLALHWTMMVGTYPIFTDVAASAGRLLTLQGAFSLSQVMRRLVAIWGERSTLKRAAQRIVRSMIQWGALRDTDTPGIYKHDPETRPVGADIALLLVEALLIDTEETSLLFDQLISHPVLFPFQMDMNVNLVRDAPHLQVHRQGLDSDIVELRRGAGRSSR